MAPLEVFLFLKGRPYSATICFFFENCLEYETWFGNCSKKLGRCAVGVIFHDVFLSSDRFDDFAIHRVVYRHRLWSDCWGNLALRMDRIISVVRISGHRDQQVLAILSQFSSAFPYFLMDMLVYCHPISGLILGLTIQISIRGCRRKWGIQYH